MIIVPIYEYLMPSIEKSPLATFEEMFEPVTPLEEVTNLRTLTAEDDIEMFKIVIEESLVGFVDSHTETFVLLHLTHRKSIFEVPSISIFN